MQIKGKDKKIQRVHIEHHQTNYGHFHRSVNCISKHEKLQTDLDETQKRIIKTENRKIQCDAIHKSNKQINTQKWVHKEKN